MMSIDRTEMAHLFTLMDSDNTGSLEKDEFVNTFQKAHTQEPHVYSMVTRLEICKMQRMLQQLLDEKNGTASALVNSVPEDSVPVGPCKSSKSSCSLRLPRSISSRSNVARKRSYSEPLVVC